MKIQLSNAAWGVLDYAAYPIGMLLAAPPLLHHLGPAQYGIWVICTAAINTGGIIASGFGDANIQHIASARAEGNNRRITRTVSNMMGIHATLGLAVALIAILFVRPLARHVVSSNSPLYGPALVSLALSAALMFIRAIESVCISTQRGFERYGKAIEVSVTARILTITIAAALALRGRGIVSIMVATSVLLALGTVLQLAQLKRLISARTLLPRFDSEAFHSLFGFGFFSWLQAVSAVLFSQADRLVLGAAIGASAVTSYALCVQLAQPIYGVAAAGLHFLFPYLAARGAKTQSLRRPIAIACAINTVYTLATSAILLSGGTSLLRLWVGTAIAEKAAPILTPIVLGTAFLSLSVPAYYALLAMGRARTVAVINIFGGLTMLLIFANVSTSGVRGIASARLIYGLISLVMYVPLLRALHTHQATALRSHTLESIGEQA